uniref:Glutamate-rich WD repeat-containing protein 1 n=1 Tax=Parascaris univalens TaxID=6257 RepID=A0A915BAM3_PARUN
RFSVARMEQCLIHFVGCCVGAFVALRLSAVSCGFDSPYRSPMDDEEDSSSGEHVMEEGGKVKMTADKSTTRKVYIPGVSRPLKEDEEWEFDPEAYRLFHSYETSWPCLSFDTVVDNLGDNRTEFPFTCFLVAGTQAERSRDNEIIAMRLSNLTAVECDAEEQSESDDEEGMESGKVPRLHAAIIPHHGGVNRLRVATLGDSRVCAVWNELAKVQLWNLNDALKEVSGMEGASRSVKLKERPLFSFVGHRAEGYALAWSPIRLGSLASGDNNRSIHIWAMGEGGQWAVDQRPLSGHTGAVEDIAWSPTEEPLLASCAGDGSVKLWDTRSAPADACVCTVPNAHELDVNVLSWNKQEPLLVTGGDDATLKVWSLKTIQYCQPVAKFKHHKGPITSVEWCPHEATTMMASGEDDQTTIWDLAVEAEPGEETIEVPPQLLFVHMGQKEVKEVHWHSQIPGLAITTALSGFNVFKTISV